jgi:microcystin-dependent protein
VGEPFLSEIRIFSFNFPPKGWAFCNGQILPINQNQALFSLLGTMYGGNGQTTFGLPNLQGRVPIHMGQGFVLGQAAGQASHTLTSAEMPAHNHMVQASTATANANIPNNTTILAATAPNDLYTGFASQVALQSLTVSSVGGSQPHQNMMPLLVLNFCIALQGIFPSRN